MPCGFIRTDNLVKNLRHYRQCKDVACQKRADQWAGTIEKFSKSQARKMQLPLSMPSKRILDSRSSCSNVGHTTTNQTQTSKHMAKANKPKKAAKAAAKAKTPAKKQVVNTGYVALIRQLLMGQKHSVADAAAAVLKKFPGKQVHSIKRIAFNVA